MKKLLVIFVMLVYGLSSTGATVHMHFCCGKLDAVSFTPVATACMPGKMVAKEGCCHNTHIELKLKADQETAVKWVHSQQVVEAPAPLMAATVFVPQKEPVNEYPTGPPLVTATIPLFISNRVFLI